MIDLTDKQKQICDMLVIGASNKQIAQEMEVSINTVKMCLLTIMKKFGVKNRTELAITYYKDINNE